MTLLITGTDTEVGKTFVGVGLITALARMGFRVGPFKPAETGCLRDAASGALIPADARLLESASGTTARLETICPYQFALPAAPWVAAEKEHRPIELAVLDHCLQQLQSSHDCVLVESAGGLLVPLAVDLTFADLALRWKLPVLVVAGSRLGALNQTLLTVRYLEHAGLPIAGCVLNHPFGDSKTTSLPLIHQAALESNAATLRRLLSCPVWEVPFAGSQPAHVLDATFDTIADHLVATLHRKQS